MTNLEYVLDTIIKIGILLTIIGLFVLGLETEGTMSTIFLLASGFFGSIFMDMWYHWRLKKEHS